MQDTKTETIYSGFLKEHQIKIHLKGRSQPLYSAEELTQIDIHWNSKIIEAGKVGKQLFDGQLLRLEQIEGSAEELGLILSPIGYKEYLYTRSIDCNLKRANPVGTCVIIITSDDYLLLTKRSNMTDLNPGKFWTAGGFLDPKADFYPEGDFYSDNPIFNCAIREVREEMGICLIPENLFLISVLYDCEFPHPEVIFLAKCTESSGELSHMDSNFETTSFRLIKVAEIDRFLEKHEGEICVTLNRALKIVKLNRLDEELNNSLYDRND